MRDTHTQAVRPTPHREPVLRGLARPVVVSAFFFMIVTGLAYPLVTTAAARVLFPARSQGSVIMRSGQPVGSAFIGQFFTRPDYFHPRPSMTSGPDPADPSKTIEQPYNGGLSAASNLGVTSKKLVDQVAARARAYREENHLFADAPVPVDAVTASGSGLDPDISLANARLQVRRVAAARRLREDEVLDLIDREARHPQFGLLGEPRVNVLEINLALDALTRRGGRQSD